MKTNSRQEFFLKKTSVLIYSLLGALELLLAVLYLLSREGQHHGEFLFGLAKRGFVELALILLLAAAFLFIFIFTLKNWGKINAALRSLIDNHRWLLLTLTLLGVLFGWAALTIPPDFFGRLSGYYQWLRPLLAVFGLIAFQGTALFLTDSGKLSALIAPFQVIKSRMFVLVLTVTGLTFALGYATGFGVISDTPLWNVPGVPVSGAQMFFLGILFGAALILETFSARFREFLPRRWAQAGILLFVFLAALLTWGGTPLLGDSLSVEPSLANPEPYPMRDARVHDLGALSILYGEGINFRGYTDKPLYMVLLAVFHLVTGYDYKLLEWVQIAFLALIPLMAYLLGRQFHSSIFGLLVAALVILQQRNAIVLSRMISSANVKILVTEPIVLMGIMLLVLLLVRWDENHEQRTLLLAGGVVGALSLIRLNPLLFLPFITLFIFVLYWKKPSLILPRILIFTAGFLIIFLPWVITGTNQQGQPFVIQKIRDVFETRISPLVHQRNGLEQPVLAGSQDGTQLVRYQPGTDMATLPDTTAILANPYQGSPSGGSQYLKMVTAHFVHNYISTVIPLPDTLSRKGIRVLAQRDYWADDRIWDGKLSSGLIRFILINLVLVSLGVAYSWKKLRWRGLVPLITYLIYNLAISISLTSGGRYVVPIIWIVFFYYAMGLAFLLDGLLRLLKPYAFDRVEVLNRISLAGKRKLWPELIALVMLALLIPAANLLVPRFVPKNPAQKASELFAALGPEKQSGRQYFTGTILYPTYVKGGGKVLFTYYRGYKVNELSAPLLRDDGSATLMNTRLRSGEPAMLVYDQDKQLTNIYIFRENKLLEYWSRDGLRNPP